MKFSVACTGSIPSGTYQCLENWFCAKGKIQKHFQECLYLSLVCLVYCIGKSTEFHDMQTECQRKIILINFLLYSLFQPLPIHLRPIVFAHQSLTPQSLSTQSLAPQRSLPD